MTKDEIFYAIKHGCGVYISPHDCVAVRTYSPTNMAEITVAQEAVTRISCKHGDWRYCGNTPSIKRVIFNPPATIVFWSDGTKTVVKCSECSCTSICKEAVNSGWCLNGREQWQRSGVIAAMLKKAYGNKAPSMLEAAVNIGEFQEGGKNG